MKKIAIGLLCALLVCLTPLALADGTSITAQGTAEISAMPAYCPADAFVVKLHTNA